MVSIWMGDADRAWELLVEAAGGPRMTITALAHQCAEGYQALLIVNRGDLALADSLAGKAESTGSLRS